MLATNTYCSGSHGDHSHATLDQGKSYSRFTPPFLAFHKSSPPPALSCVMRCVRERGKRWKATLHQNKWNCKPTDICISFSHKKILFCQEKMVSNVLTKTVVQGFGWDMIKNIKEISIVSNKTMLIMWLKIFSLGHLAVVENWITGLDLLRHCLRNGSINCVFKWTWEPLFIFPFIVI